MFRLELHGRFVGPIADKRADAVAERLLERAKRDVAEAGVGEVVQRMRDSIRKPTPVLWTKVSAVPSPIRPDAMSVTGQGVLPYEHWIEGTGSRNYPRTRFRGYRAFARSVGPLTRAVRGIVEKALPTYLRGMR